MQIMFIGATHEVTGSCTVLEVGRRYYLVDCGMEQGLDVFENVPLPVAASEIEAVFLTHAHIDHSGMLPKLYQDGFRGTIYATEATCDLCNIMLRDSAHIQESEAEWKTRKAERAGGEAARPLYDMKDAEGAISLFRRCQYNERSTIAEGIDVRFTDIGHLLGSACIELWLTEEGDCKKIVFSGDVGNTNQPIIKDPQTVAETDYLVIESTYGNRLHEVQKDQDIVQELANDLQKTFDRGGSVVIPSFAVGRTQEMLYALREIKQNNLVQGHPHFPVYVDSPLAVEATAIFMQCDHSCFDEEMMELIRQGINPIWFEDIHLSVSSDESRAINLDLSPKVILSASGMCEAGRIRHHLKHNLWRRENMILFVGYQAEGSLGRNLLEGVQNVRLFGEDIAVRAEVCSLHGTSGHADQNGLLHWLQSFERKPQQIFINHGDDEACEAFRKLLTETYGYQADAPFSGTAYDLRTGRMVVYTEGKKVDHMAVLKGHARATAVYRELVEAAETLLSIAKEWRGHSNKDIAKFTAQIRSLISKWKP